MYTRSRSLVWLLSVCVKSIHLVHDSYLVDPASSHMLVSKIKPCMSKYKQLCTVKLRMAHYNSYNLFDSFYYLDNRGNSRANTCDNTRQGDLACGIY